ncbi:hypothetical protein TSUD_230000 [Trifolium subterraneum]|uniref:Fungal lipase-like domain-containing protein n=1 Tax=Trifolium subterraneum TaxID=3900 RepID=A0A2Z6MD68_TRISU|nr:hypothetical protein TSUD_230000 [Trifolium subterraneum]
MVASVGGNGSNIWLAGHSLGSSIALHAGKTMAKSGIRIESFLFNPPFPSVPLDQIINSKRMKHGIRIFGSVARAGVGIFMNSDKKSSFSALSDWFPRLFVNQSDYICSKYVEYFEHRRKMENIGAGRIEKIATQTSVSCQMMRGVGMKSETVHLIPSAILTVNLTPQHDFIEAHRIDQWDHAYHRKSVAASLVQGVYVLERDQQKRKGSDSQAFRWFEFFHFQLIDTLIDDVDSPIFGATYEFKLQPSMCNYTLHRIPRYVIAFRGTITKLDSFLRDIKLDLKILKNGLHRASRSKIAIETVRKMVDTVDGNGSNIWLAGHSLGSCIALHAGKTMAKSGIFIESFLFNPPFASAPIDQIINSEKTKHGIRFFGSMLRVGLAIAMNSDKKTLSYDSFAALSAWIPCLFVNPSDFICSEYVGYFKHRRKMEEIGAGSIEKIATQNSLVSLMMSAFGKESELVHLIPSAILTVNLTPQ